jgi:hypothetical protein
VSTSVPPPNMPAPLGSDPPPAPASARPGPGLRSKLLTSALGLAVLAGIAFAVFGSTTSNLVDPVALAATHSASAAGYRVRFSLEVSSSELATPITMVGGGVVDSRDRSASMSLTARLPDNPQVVQQLGSSTLTVDSIIDGTTVYMKLPAALTSQIALAGKSWIAVNLAKISQIPALSSLGGSPMSSDPSQMLQYLRAASDSVVTAGRERVNGFETTHYRVALNLSRVLGALPASDQAAAQQGLSAIEQQLHLGDVPVDVWIDAHHLVRRMTMTLDGTVASGSTLAETMTMDVRNYGRQQRPTPPPADQVVNVS